MCHVHIPADSTGNDDILYCREPPHRGSHFDRKSVSRSWFPNSSWSFSSAPSVCQILIGDVAQLPTMASILLPQSHTFQPGINHGPDTTSHSFQIAHDSNMSPVALHSSSFDA